MEKSKDSEAVGKLILGTAQFGMDYGIANRLGQPDIGQVRDILDLAYDLGVRILDTAATYGDSEAFLGLCDMDRWSVITKVPSFRGIDDSDIGAKARGLAVRSMELLGVDSLNAVLAHDRRDMVGDRGRRMRETLEPLINTGQVGRIGVSIYAPQDMDGIDPANARIVQVPFNVLDQRFVASGAGARLRARSGELHVRSVFLQGLLLMPAQERPARFAAWAHDLERYDERVRDSGLAPAAFCLGFAARQADVAHCVVGVDSAQQLSELVAAFDVGQRAAIDAKDLRSDDTSLIDPRHWKDNT